MGLLLPRARAKAEASPSLLEGSQRLLLVPIPPYFIIVVIVINNNIIINNNNQSFFAKVKWRL